MSNVAGFPQTPIANNPFALPTLSLCHLSAILPQSWIFDNLVEIHVYFLDSADERSNMGPPKILIFGERRKCRDLNSRASSLSQATYDEAVAIDFGELRANDSELKD